MRFYYKQESHTLFVFMEVQSQISKFGIAPNVRHCSVIRCISMFICLAAILLMFGVASCAVLV